MESNSVSFAHDSREVTAARYFASVGMTAIATIVAIGVDRHVSIPNVSLIFVVPVIVSAINLGLGPSVLSAVLGSLAYNFFLTDPRYTLMVDDPAYIWAIGLLLMIGLIVSGVAFTSRRHAREAALLRQQSSTLRHYTSDVMKADSAEAIAVSAARTASSLFRVPAVVIIATEDGIALTETSGGLTPQAWELDAARSTLNTKTSVRGGVYPDVESRFDFWPFDSTEPEHVILGIAFDPNDRPQSPDEAVQILGNVTVLALARQRGASTESKHGAT